MTQTLWRPRALFGLAVLAVLAACSSEPLGLRAPLASRLAGTQHFNSQKYRDTGSHPVGGRSGSAGIQAEVLIGAGGQVTVAVTSYRADDFTTPAGGLERIQVKAFDGAGRLLATRNLAALPLANSFSALLAGLTGAATFQVQATVRGIDGRRTDVVTVGGIVPAVAPDLAVTHVAVPATAIAGAPTVIGATVVELGGAHGARGNCVLYVNGVAVDHSNNIWVDAGDAVGCAFTRTFGAAGAYAMRVAVEQVFPADDNPSNNSATASLAVVAPSVGGASATFDGIVRSGTFVASDTFETTWLAPDGSLFLTQQNGSTSSGTDQSFILSGVIGTTLTLPLTRIEMAQNADGRLIQSVRLDDVAATFVGSGVACTSSDDGHGTQFFLCAYQQGFSALTFMRNAGTVTYQSSEFSKIWNGASYDEDTYIVNDTATNGTFVPVSNHFTINIQVTDGTTLYAMDATAALAPVLQNDVEARHCSSGPIVIAPTTYQATTCVASSFAFTGIAGTMSGSGMTATLTP